MDGHTAALLRSAGLRATAGRVAVLDALWRTPHVDADRLFQEVSQTLPHTSIQSTHNILTDLTAAGLVHRIEPAGYPALYERRVGDNHHHAICRVCGRVDDIDCVVGSAPCLDPGSAHGYAVDVADIVFWGVCPKCQAATSPGDVPSVPFTTKENHVR